MPLAAKTHYTQAKLLFDQLEHSIAKERKRSFLAAFVLTGGLYRTCATVGVHPSIHYVWLKTDPMYVEAYKQAQVMAADILEDAAFTRAVDGVDRPIYYQGALVGYAKEYSDGLLKFLLKGLKPDRYGDKADITSAGRALRIVISDDGDEEVVGTPEILDDGNGPPPSIQPLLTSGELSSNGHKD